MLVAAVLVHIDLDGDRPHPASLVALAAGRHVASAWGATLYAVVILRDRGRGIQDPAARGLAAAKVPGIEGIELALARGGADKVVVALTKAPITPLWASVGNAWVGVLDHLRPKLVLFGADSPSAPELAPRTGARIGARLLGRARAIGIDDVELRDRDGGYVRVTDSGAAVAVIGHAAALAAVDVDIDVLVLSVLDGADPRIEVVATAPAELAHTCGTVVALADDVASDPAIVGDARRLAAQIGAQVIAGPAGAAAVQPGAIVERTTALAPELCVLVGAAQVDLSGATAIVKIGAQGGKLLVDGALPGPVDIGLAELVKKLEET
jgi:hypothetical protein